MYTYLQLTAVGMMIQCWTEALMRRDVTCMNLELYSLLPRSWSRLPRVRAHLSTDISIMVV